ncbi:DUF5916 domain-containing protein [Aequorivita sp. 609]
MPGNQLILFYPNAMKGCVNDARISFHRNFKNLFDEPQLNNISL